MTEDRQTHWQGVYGSKRETEVSWFEDKPATSLELIGRAGIAKDSAIIDIGGGASRLVDRLLDTGYRAISVLDISDSALAAARARLGPRAAQVKWIAADVTEWGPPQKYHLWHDRAAFHFLTAQSDRNAYVERLTRALDSGGQVIIGTFALDGPERCSGLPVVRYDAEALKHTLGETFALEETLAYSHQTPGGSTQKFQFSRFRKK